MRAKSVIALAAFVACADGGPTAPLDRNFRIAPGQTAFVKGTALTLTFKRVIEDSRCVTGAECVSAGVARIEITATLNGDPTNFTLATTHIPGVPNTSTESFVGGYRVKITSLDPAPRPGHIIEPRDYRATLMVEVAGCPPTMLCAS